MHIACLHTVDSNVGLFDAAGRELGRPAVQTSHHVRADLLAAAERAGGPTADILDRTATALCSLCAGADAVLLTCSTLGPAADRLRGTAPAPVLRVDDALARAAVAAGGRVAVLCAAATTLAPTRELFERAARATGAAIAVRLVDGAWAAFKAGDGERYLALIAAAAQGALAEGATRVALAQASMAAAAQGSGGAVLASPRAGLLAAIAAASAAAAGGATDAPIGRS